MSQTPLNKKDLVLEFNSQESRALRIAKALKSNSFSEKRNFLIHGEVEIIDGVVSIKHRIVSYPKIKVTARESDDENEYFIVKEFDNIDLGAE